MFIKLAAGILGLAFLAGACARDSSDQTAESSSVGGLAQAAHLPSGLSPSAKVAVVQVGDTYELSDEDETCIGEQLLESDPALFANLDDEEFTESPEAVIAVLDAFQACVSDETTAYFLAQGILEDSPDLATTEAACVADAALAMESGILQDILVSEVDPVHDPADDTIVAVFGLLDNCDLTRLLGPEIQGAFGDLDPATTDCLTKGLVRLDDPTLVALLRDQPGPAAIEDMLGLLNECGAMQSLADTFAAELVASSEASPDAAACVADAVVALPAPSLVELIMSEESGIDAVSPGILAALETIATDCGLR